jgi:DNA-binding beta-propeller fold protein YncE
MKTTVLSISLSAVALGGSVSAQESVGDLVSRGQELFHADVGCWVCHGETAEGRLGPNLLFGPTPMDIFDQLESNPMMGVIVQELDPSDADLVAISMYIRSLAELPSSMELADQYLDALVAHKASQPPEVDFPKSQRDLDVEAIESFGSVLTRWERRAKEGSVLSHYDTQVVATFDPGEPKFTPEPGKTYFYENTGTNSVPQVLFEGYMPPKSNQVVVGDAATKEIIASYEIPVELRATVHTSAVSSDGKYVYMVGARPGGDFDQFETVGSSATLLKIDALTLQPIKQISIGARLHHSQVFRDYLLLDMFTREADGLAFVLYDTDTDEIVGGVKDIDMGGFVYTVWSDKDYEYLYALMEPAGYARGRATGMVASINFYEGRLVAMRPFWIAKIDPETWEVVQEIPIPGYRPNWAVVDSQKKYLYVATSSSHASKIDLETGAVVWTGGTGIGAYGVTLNADETELWIADKGEGAHHLGRTITVFDTELGHASHTLYGAYKVDHVLLSPNGKEMWATSNGEGRIYVYDAESKELTHKIDMPQNGDAHGLIWVHYDENGVPAVVRDQGGFHNGIHPALGRPLEY